MKHTPGPWIMKTEETDPDFPHAQMRHCVNSESGKAICALWHRTKPYKNPHHFKAGNFVEDEAEVDANAKLIAAAPELLAALKAARDNGVEDDPEVWRQIDEAIAKAE